jgi:hypothetical protein
MGLGQVQPMHLLLLGFILCTLVIIGVALARSVRTSDTHPGRIAGRGTVVDGLFRAGSSVRTNGSEENCGRRAEA